MSGLQTAYARALLAHAAARPEVVVLTAENRALIRGLEDALGPRFVDVGIAEQTLVGMAAGLALRGRTPVVHGLAAFVVMRAFEFVRTDVGIAGLPVKLMGHIPGFLSEANGPTHQALEDVALMRGVPGIQVVCPADECELVEALPAILDSPHPCYVRLPAGPPAVTHQEGFALGRAEVLSRGDGVGLLTYGGLLAQCDEARRILESRGVRVRLVNLRTLRPLDEEQVVETARATRLLVTVEDHFVTGGLYSIVAEILVRRGIHRPLHPLALKEAWFRPGLLADVLAAEGFTGDAIARRVFRERCGTALQEGTHAERR